MRNKDIPRFKAHIPTNQKLCLKNFEVFVSELVFLTKQPILQGLNMSTPSI